MLENKLVDISQIIKACQLLKFGTRINDGYIGLKQKEVSIRGIFNQI